ncbi:hypothetical protein AB0O34_23955 [Sphaerisporangium sp. NPDC088356]|uniref:hypothetical protein n=1 Tax=Sphaerisporangium sp. NPDC088356 TaxID=3154871 RepID=UPI0034129D9A
MITFQPGRHALRLRPAVGGALVELSLAVSRNSESKEPRPMQISATMRVSRVSHSNSRPLCKIEANNVITPHQQATEHIFVGFISDAQVRAVEELRLTGRLWITLDLNAIWVSPNPDASLNQRTSQLNFDVPSGEWIEELERVDAATHVELLIPITDNTKHAKAAHRIRTARDHLRQGENGAAVGEIRKPLDRIRRETRTRPVAQAALNKDRLIRDQDERWAVFIEALFDLLSGEAHDDPGTTEHFTWTRAEAAVLTATVAGLLARQAEAQPPAI